MPSKKKYPPTETNPEQLPEFTPSEDVEPSDVDHSKALTTVQDMLRGVATADEEVKIIEILLAMPNDGSDGLVKIYGLSEACRFLRGQHKRVELLMAEIIAIVHDKNLWKLVAEHNGYDTEQQFWEDLGWEWPTIQRIANFTKHVKPMLEIVGIDVENFYESTGPKAMAQVTRTAQDLRRQIPEFKSTAKPSSQIKVDDDTREAIKDNLLMFQGIPESQVKSMVDMQRGKDLPEPIEVTVKLQVVNRQVQVFFSGACDPEQFEKVPTHAAYYAYYYQGHKSNPADIAKIARDMQQQLDDGSVVEGSIEPYETDDYGLDDDDYTPLVAHRAG